MSFQLLTLLTSAAGMALIGLAYGATVVYFILAALLAVLIVSYASSRLSTRSLTWQRDLPSRVFEQEPFTVTTALTNRGRLPRFLLTVLDRLPQFLRADTAPDFVLPALWPQENVRLSYQARALKRGVYSLGPLSISVADPFGIFHRLVPLQAPGEAVVYPRPLPLRSLHELDQSVGEYGFSSGERSQATESGLDFYGIRDYQPGDELRRIYWPATARHGRLTVIEYEQGASRSLAVLLDAAAGSEFGSGLDTTLETAVRVSASLLHWTLGRQGRAVLALDSPNGPLWIEMDRPEREYEALEALARVQANAAMPISQLVEWAVPRLLGGGAVCIITAAPDPHLPRAISVLRGLRLPVALVLLDAATFDPRVHRLALTAPLEAVGAATTTIARGDDLAAALKETLFASR